MTIKEARIWLRRAVKDLNGQSRLLKEDIRKRHTTDTPGQQSRLATTQQRLTVLHAMLAYSRGRLHPVTKGTPGPIFTPAENKKFMRTWIESRGEARLGHWWTGVSFDGERPPALRTVWSAISLIPDPEARVTAVQLAGPEAGYR